MKSLSSKSSPLVTEPHAGIERALRSFAHYRARRNFRCNNQNSKIAAALGGKAKLINQLTTLNASAFYSFSYHLCLSLRHRFHNEAVGSLFLDYMQMHPSIVWSPARLAKSPTLARSVPWSVHVSVTKYVAGRHCMTCKVDDFVDNNASQGLRSFYLVKLVSVCAVKKLLQ